MAAKPITVLGDTQPMPVLDACKWQRLEGEPHRVNLDACTSDDGSKIMGTWICTPGIWRVDYLTWEYCYFQELYCTVTPDGQAPIHLKAGDIFVVEPGHDRHLGSSGIGAQVLSIRLLARLPTPLDRLRAGGQRNRSALAPRRP